MASLSPCGRCAGAGGIAWQHLLPVRGGRLAGRLRTVPEAAQRLGARTGGKLRSAGQLERTVRRGLVPLRRGRIGEALHAAGPARRGGEGGGNRGEAALPGSRLGGVRGHEPVGRGSAWARCRAWSGNCGSSYGLGLGFRTIGRVYRDEFPRDWYLQPQAEARPYERPCLNRPAVPEPVPDKDERGSRNLALLPEARAEASSCCRVMPSTASST